MDIKEILKEKIESAKKELEVAKTQSTSEAVCFQAKVDAYYDCLTLIEQFERPTKVITIDSDDFLNAEHDICPHCKGILNKNWFNDFQRDKTPCCPFCGGNLDWEEGEKK